MIKSVRHGIPFLIQIGYTIFFYDQQTFFMTNKPLNLCAWQTFVTKKCIIGKIGAWQNQKTLNSAMSSKATDQTRFSMHSVLFTNNL